MQMRRATYLEFLNGLVARGTRAGDLDDVGGVHIGELSRVDRLANLVVRTRAGELDLRPSAVLQVVEVLAAAADEGTVLCDRDLNTEDHTVLERRDGLLELCLELRD